VWIASRSATDTTFVPYWLSAVGIEWRLMTATHNLLKLHKHQLATAIA
jgi:hypothetical protein